jgi:hypothetical protein
MPSAVCGNDSAPNTPKECRASPRILWDFVDFCRARFKSEVTFAPKLRAFSQLVHVRIYEVAGIPFALSTPTHKIGFPGWPEPILDSVTGFGASIEKKGACTSPLFRFVSSPAVDPSDTMSCHATTAPSLNLASRLALSLPPGAASSSSCFSLRLCAVNCRVQAKKMSGRWGHRPLGRGG